MKIQLTQRRKRLATFMAVSLVMLGFLCQVLALDHWVNPIEAAGSPTHASTEFCHGSLSNCAGTVDVGSSLQATLAPPIPPDERPDALDVAVAALIGHSPVLTDPPPQSA